MIAVSAFYGEYTWTQGPAMYVQRNIIEGDVLNDLVQRLCFYEEARCLGMAHTGAVFVAEDCSTGAAIGFADIGVTIWDGSKSTFSLPKRPEGDPNLSGRSTVELRPYLSNLAVDPTRRRSGVGRQLVEACEAEARSWDTPYESIWLEVSATNDAASELYRRCGYIQEAQTFGKEIVKERWGFESQQVRRLLMRKHLPRTEIGDMRGMVVPTAPVAST